MFGGVLHKELGMANKEISRSELRAYLLGKLSSEEALESIEERLVSDPEFAEAVYAEEDELIDDLVCGELEGEELEAFHANFVLSPERRARIETAGMIRELAKRRAGSSLRAVVSPDGIFARIAAWFAVNRSFAAAALGAIVVAAVFVAWYATQKPNGSEAVIASLNKAYERERPIESRITGLGYAPKIDRRGDVQPAIDGTARDKAELLALTANSEDENAGNLHQLARVYLAKRDFDGAAKLLERSVALDPANYLAVADLGTAYLELGGSLPDEDGGRRLELYARALEQFDRALSKQPALTEPRFNRAIAMEKLEQPRQAADAWRKYLEIDPSSRWADEARQRLAALESTSSVTSNADSLMAEFLTAYRQNDEERAFRIVSKNREMITGKLIPQQLAFLFTSSANREERTDLVNAMRFIGAAELRRTADPFWKDLADHYASSGETTIAELRAGHSAIRAGYANALAGNYESAYSNFTSARTSFGSAGSQPEVAITDYWIGYAADRLTRIQEAESVLIEAASRARPKGYSWLMSQYLCWLGQIKFSRNESSRSIEFAEEALAFADRASDSYNRQKLFDLLTINYRGLGAFTDALSYAERSLALANDPASTPRQRWRTLNTVAEVFISMGYHAAAESLERESLELNRSGVNEGTFEHMSLLRLGQMAALRGEPERSAEYLEQSRAVLQNFNAGERARHTAYLDLTTAHVLRDFDRCTDAIPLYDRAIEYYDNGEFTVDRYDAYKGRLICYLNGGNTAAIDTQIPEVLGILDRYREAIREESNRNAFFGKEQEIYDALIDFELTRGNAEKGFEYAEQSRARTLLDMIANGPDDVPLDAEPVLPAGFVRPLDLAAIRQQMSSDTQLVQFSMLDSRIAAWVIDRDSFRYVTTSVDADELSQNIADYIAMLSMPGNTARNRRDEIGRRLGQLLIEPIRAWLDNSKAIVVVPDRSIAALPFGALISPASGDFLIKEFELQYAPSASIYISVKNASAGTLAENEKLLAVGDPAFDRSAFRNLPELPAAGREANSVAANYPGATTLLNSAATRDSVLAELKRSDVFHFAGHYVYDGRSPMRSGLLLAGRGDTLLANRDIARMRLNDLNLVVLSACETGSEQVINGEGMLGAARTFLAAGIPLVVASHWEVDSEATAELMTNFHKLRKSNGLSSVRALRMAQLSMLESPDPRFREPFYWAPFIAYGANN